MQVSLDVSNRKMPGGKILGLRKMLQVATPNRAPPKLLSRLLKVVDTPIWGAKWPQSSSLWVRKAILKLYNLPFSRKLRKTASRVAARAEYLSPVIKVVDTSIWGSKWPQSSTLWVRKAILKLFNLPFSRKSQKTISRVAVPTSAEFNYIRLRRSYRKIQSNDV